MSKPQVVQEELGPKSLELIQMAALGVGIVLRAEVVGFILHDERGLSIIPKPGVGRELFGALAQCDWATQVRLAEEFDT